MGAFKRMKDMKDMMHAAPGLIEQAREAGVQAQEMAYAQQAAIQAQLQARQAQEVTIERLAVSGAIAAAAAHGRAHHHVGLHLPVIHRREFGGSPDSRASAPRRAARNRSSKWCPRSRR